MQRIALLSLLVFALFSCEDLEDNNAIIQGSANDVFLKGGAVATRYDDGRVVIAGNTDDEELRITLTGIGAGSYAFGPGRANGATFIDASGETYSTGTALGDGQATINVSNPEGLISGTFVFNAHTFALQDTLNFQRGVFWQVPVITGTGQADNPGLAYGMSGTVNELLFEAVTLEANNVLGFIEITGVEGAQSIFLKIPNTYGPGDYDLASGDFEASYTLDGATSVATTGVLTILFNEVGTGEIAGTFSIAGDGFEIINGAFSGNY